ncbi:MAG: hypothetical protein ACK417_01570 [Bacteroidia bacterium]
MCFITLICTKHSALGKCNSEELYQILKAIKPPVVFDEVPASYFDAYYGTKSRKSLESEAINEYLKDHKAEIIPADIDTSQALNEFQMQFRSLFSKIFQNQDYIKLEKDTENMIIQHGFNYLNGIEFLEYLDQKEALIQQIIASETDRDRLQKTYHLFQYINHDSRENAMLQNIYNYSKEAQYSQAVFLLGAEHRKSLMEKIPTFEASSNLELKWKTYGDL